MKKKLISEKNINDFLCDGDDRFYVDTSMILSPIAKDILSNRGIKIIYGEKNRELDQEKAQNKQKDCCNGDFDIAKSIVNILINDFNISDSEEIKEITARVLSKIKE